VDVGFVSVVSRPYRNDDRGVGDSRCYLHQDGILGAFSYWGGRIPRRHHSWRWLLVWCVLMDQVEFDQIKTTFPWSERILQTNVGGLVQILDNRGHEVSIFTMSRFLQMITTKLVKQSEPENSALA
jgi:hypothetical protein